jgi:hypothetical protein
MKTTARCVVRNAATTVLKGSYLPFLPGLLNLQLPVHPDQAEGSVRGSGTSLEDGECSPNLKKQICSMSNKKRPAE